MAHPEPSDEEVAALLLQSLREDEAASPADLPERTLRKVRSSVTFRDLIDLTTFVFIAQFCAPLIDLVAALFGVESSTHRRDHDE